MWLCGHYEFAQLCIDSTYMPWRGGEFFLAVGPSSARSDDCLVAMKMNLCLQLVPQFVMLRTSHVSTQQLYLLYSETQLTDHQKMLWVSIPLVLIPSPVVF